MSQSLIHDQRTLCKHEKILVVGNTDDTDDASRIPRRPEHLARGRSHA